MTSHDIEYLIKQALPDAQVVIEDIVGDNNHYRALITSSAFKGKSRLAQHKMVYAALGSQMGNELHALTFKTQSPAVQS